MITGHNWFSILFCQIHLARSSVSTWGGSITSVTTVISLCTKSTCSLHTCRSTCLMDTRPNRNMFFLSKSCFLTLSDKVSMTGNDNLPEGESLIHVLHMWFFLKRWCVSHESVSSKVTIQARKPKLDWRLFSLGAAVPNYMILYISKWRLIKL